MAGKGGDGPPHPSIDYDDTFLQWIFGIHIQYHRFRFHANYYYFSDEIGSARVAPPVGVEPTATSLEWANVSFEYRW